jgi:solute carrier family 25 (adenine nucleotide translocator) protein 4/5/6/31
VIDCFKKTYKNEGLEGFWKGAYSNILRSVGSSLCLILYDEFRKISTDTKF